MMNHLIHHPAQQDRRKDNTDLTRALEYKCYKYAERLIRECLEVDYLDDGPQDKTPLSLVLSSDSLCDYQGRTVNLKLARLLVEKGADPNFQVVHWKFGRMDRFSASPLQHLVVYCLDISDFCRKQEREDPMDCEYDFVLNAIGFNGEEDLPSDQLKQMAYKLLEIFLERGGNVDLPTPPNQRSILHVALANHEQHLDLIKKLVESGGHVNIADIHGGTPIMDLAGCRYPEAFEVLEYLWSCCETPDVSTITCAGKTAMWEAMYNGNPKMAIALIKKDALATQKAVVETDYVKDTYPDVNISTVHSVSPLFAPLLCNSHPHSQCYSDPNFEFDKFFLDKIIRCGMSPVLDAGYLNVPEVNEELKSMLMKNTHFRYLSTSAHCKSQALLPLMFGQLGTGLKQLCVRTILNTVVFRDIPGIVMQKLKDLDHPGKKRRVKKKPNEEINWYITHTDIAYLLIPNRVKTLVKLLKLPPELSVFFEIEAAKCQIAATLYLFQCVRCVAGCDGFDLVDTSDEWSDVSYEDYYQSWDYN